MSPEVALTEIRDLLKSRSNEAARIANVKAVPGIDATYNVRMPYINEIARSYKNGGFDLIIALWHSGTYAERMLAAKLLGFNCKKDPTMALRLLQDYRTDIDNWALCDTLCSEGIRPIVKSHEYEIMSIAKQFLTDKSMWVRRMGIVLLIHYAKIPEKKGEVLELIEPLKSDQEHYIKKAMAWIMRYLNKH